MTDANKYAKALSRLQHTMASVHRNAAAIGRGRISRPGRVATVFKCPLCTSSATPLAARTPWEAECQVNACGWVDNFATQGGAMHAATFHVNEQHVTRK